VALIDGGFYMKKHSWIIFLGLFLWASNFILRLIDSSFCKSLANVLGWAFVLPVVLLAFFVIFYLVSYVDKLVNPGIQKNNNIDKYLQLRDSVKTGDVLAFKSGGITGFLIGIVSDYTHVGMIVRFNDLTGGDRVFILEALDDKGIVLMPLSAKLYQYEGQAWWFKLSAPKNLDEQCCRESCYQYLMQQLGKNYNYADIKKIVEKFFKGDYLHTLQDPNRMICSELVARALVSVGLVSIPDCSTITPGQVVKLPVFIDKPVQFL
jgi:hypothetical protein